MPTNEATKRSNYARRLMNIWVRDNRKDIYRLCYAKAIERYPINKPGRKPKAREVNTLL